MNHSSPLGITRERSFVRTPTQQHQVSWSLKIRNCSVQRSGLLS
jgi:hypothetical protein